MKLWPCNGGGVWAKTSNFIASARNLYDHRVAMANVVTLLLSHQRNSDLARVLKLWQQVTAADRVLVAYGGDPSEFERISWPHKVFVADPRLRTRDHQRERQSYTGVLKAARAWLSDRPELTFVHVVEFDHVPLIADLYAVILRRLRDEDADVLAHHLQRIDGTNHPHYLYHASEPQFGRFLAEMTTRSDSNVVLSMLGTGSFWTREAFDAVGELDEPFPIYNEVYLPTIAHHLGFRLRGFAEQDAFIHARGEFGDAIAAARDRGAWMLHPVKDLPQSTGSMRRSRTDGQPTASRPG